MSGFFALITGVAGGVVGQLMYILHPEEFEVIRVERIICVEY